MTALQPGIHPNISSDDYHRGHQLTPAPALSAGYAHTLLTKSPRHAWITHPQLGAQKLTEDDGKFDLGTTAHALMLQGADITEEERIFRDADDGIHAVTQVFVDGKPFALVVPITDWRTSFAKATRATARREGLIPLKVVDYLRAKEMVASVREQLATFDVDPPLFPAAGKPEQTVVWQEPNGVWCRARADWLHDDYRFIDDLKSTKASANPHDWTRTTMWGIGADIEAAFHTRGVHAITGIRPEMRFVVAETSPPYALSVVSLAPDALALADEKVERALQVWKDCITRDQWPSYPRQPVYAELPPWSEARWLERQALEEMEEEVVA